MMNFTDEPRVVVERIVLLDDEALHALLQSHDLGILLKIVSGSW